jgi:hypothetical protein
MALSNCRTNLWTGLFTIALGTNRLEMASSPFLQPSVTKALEMDVELDKAKDIDDEAIDEFLGNYELLDAAYRHGLISADMAYDAFEADLETALKDARAGAS